MVRVLYVLSASSFNTLLANTLPFDTTSLRIVTRDNGLGELRSQMQSRGVSVGGIGGGGLIAEFGKLLSIVRSFDPDVVEMHGFPSSIFAPPLQMVCGRRLRTVTVRHHNLSHHLRGLHRAARADKISAQASDAVVAVSQSVRETLIAEGANANKITVIPNAVPVADPNQLSTRRRPPRVGERVELLTVGRLEWDKNYEGLLKALGEIADARLPVRLRIAGVGPDRYTQNLKILARRLPDSVTVEWLGWRSDIPRLMCESDLLVHNARDEAFGLVALEALRHGLPVVSTNAGGLREVVGTHYPLSAPDEVGEFAALLRSSILSLAELCEHAKVVEREMRTKFLPIQVQRQRHEFYMRLTEAT